MPNYPINLGKTFEGPPMLMGGSVAAPEPQKHYPTLYLEWDESYDLPDSGTMTVKFKKNSETNSKRKGGMHQSVSLDILEITSVKGRKSEPEAEDPGNILDRLKKESEDAFEENAESYKEE